MTSRTRRDSTKHRIGLSALLRIAATAALCSSSLATSFAHADTTDAPPTSGAQGADDPYNHHERAHTCRIEKNFECALTELRAAYALDPAPQILVNIGMVQCDLHQYPEALATYRRALEPGKEYLSADQKADVQNRIAELERPVDVSVSVNVPGAAISVDGAAKGSSPLLAPLPLPPGWHQLRVSRAGYQEQQRSVLVEPQGTVGPQQFVLISNHTSKVSWVTIGWVTAGGLAAGALVTGAFAYSASEKQKDKLGSYPGSHSDLENNSSKVKLWSDVTTALALTSVAAAGATFLVYTSSKSSSDAEPTKQAVAIGVGPGELRAKVTF